MAAKSKKRLSKIDNKLLNLEKLELKDLVCSICQSILTEPVTLPCFHYFCLHCFNGNTENNALCCPLCRLRIGSWLRSATKQKNLVNEDLWKFIRIKFSREVDIKISGGDIEVLEEKPKLRLSNPGEIRSEYESELQRLRAERQRLEEKHIKETELLIREIQKEEEEAHRKYLECLKKDEILAQQIQNENMKASSTSSNIAKKGIQKGSKRLSKFKPTKIDSFLTNLRQTSISNDSPLLIDNETTAQKDSAHQISGASPEMIPNYGKAIRNIIDKKNKTGSCLWNKENGENRKEKIEDVKSHNKEIDDKSEDKDKAKNKTLIPSLLVSLPLPNSGIRPKNLIAPENRNLETGSVDSMHQELCYFKPIEGTTPTSFNTKKTLPIRVPGLKKETCSKLPHYQRPPSRAQYLEGLCQLRNISIAKNLPSAFAIALSVLKVQKENPVKCETLVKLNIKKTESTSPITAPAVLGKKISNKNKATSQIEETSILAVKTNLRRTRSMGSIPKDDNETTPKKVTVKQRKVSSERKPYLRSNNKRNKQNKLLSPTLVSESLDTKKINVAVKNLSSPLENCDVKKILDEQLRIEQLIEQEKSDLDLARKMDAEWNGRRQLRRAAAKRQLTLAHHLRPPKKLKV